MSVGLMIFFGLIKIGLVDQVINNIAYVEYITVNNKIEYITLPIGKTDCPIKEGTRVYFDHSVVIGCL